MDSVFFQFCRLGELKPLHLLGGGPMAGGQGLSPDPADTCSIFVDLKQVNAGWDCLR